MKFWHEHIKYGWLGIKLFKLHCAYHDFVNGIKSLWFWKGVIWRNRAWDYAYLFIVMEHQLARMEPCIRNGYSVNAEKTANEIKLARFALQRLIKDDYILQEDPIFRKKKKFLAKFNKKFFADYMQQQDINYLCKLMRKKLRGWRD